MDTTTQLTGTLPAILIISAILTALASWFLLRLYKKATTKGMIKHTGSDIPLTKNRQTASPGSELHFETLNNENVKGVSSSLIYRRLQNSLRSLVITYVAGGIGYALCMTIAYLVIAGNGFVLGTFIWLLTCFLWPTILTITVVSPKDGHKPRSTVLIYFAIVFIVALITSSRSSDVGLGQLAFFWLWVNGPSTVLLFAFLRRKVRAVGPMVLAFMILGIAGANMALNTATSNDAVLNGIVELGAPLGLGAMTIIVLILAIGFVLFGLVGWMFLKKIGGRYQKKKFSDQSLIIDSLWLIFGVVQSISLAFEGVLWIFTGIIAFIAYKLISKIGFRWKLKGAMESEQAPSLLILRVFALGSRSERIFEGLSKWWRNIGSINLISGPDLISSTTEPHEFFDFLGGRLSRQFVYDRADLDRRLSAMDLGPDPDGRYRTNDFFCRADNWKITMQSLSRQSDVVLMDLRSFSDANKGCIYELDQLIDIVSVSKIIFLVDTTTDLHFLKETLKSIWKGIDPDSPNLIADTSIVSLFHLKKDQYPTKLLLSNLIERLV